MKHLILILVVLCSACGVETMEPEPIEPEEVGVAVYRSLSDGEGKGWIATEFHISELSSIFVQCWYIWPVNYVSRALIEEVHLNCILPGEYLQLYYVTIPDIEVECLIYRPSSSFQ